MLKVYLNKWGLMLLLATLLLIGIYSTVSLAEQGKANALFSDSGPIEITSLKLTADSERNLAVFEGNVVARQGKTILKAQWMEVKYTEDGEVKAIHARGNVSVKKQSQTITSDEVFYYKDRAMVVFTGNPKATDNGTIIRGSKITYYIDSGNSVVENSHVTIKKTRKKDGS